MDLCAHELGHQRQHTAQCGDSTQHTLWRHHTDTQCGDSTQTHTVDTAHSVETAHRHTLWTQHTL